MPPKNPRAKKPAAALEAYRRKRNFNRTPEPAPGKAKNAADPIFVIQEHHARSHHFDLRLQMNGALASWAVPKGMPEDASSRRLAVHVEDHPLDYANFEGTIPAGNYGAGTVAIWDRGRWAPVDDNWEASFKRGRLKFILRGERVFGTYLLARMQDGPNWLLRKIRDDAAAAQAGNLPREKPAFISPQLARLTTTVPDENHWWHELKLDGYRLIAVKNEREVRLWSRNAIDWTGRFKPLAEALMALSRESFVLDGEAVVFDGSGRSRFGDLQAALQQGQLDRISFVAFDLLHFAGRSLREWPLSQRVQELQKLVADDTGRIRRSKVWTGKEGRELFRQACQIGLEGIISKNSAGRYLPGMRRDWLKFKCRARQEFIICGYTPPQGSLRGFGALLLASFENGDFVPRGKVGTGFSDRERMRLLGLFKERVTNRALWPERDSRITWIEPDLVAEVEYAEITRGGLIRQGSFVGLREDKTPSQVQLDEVAPSGSENHSMKVAGITISHPERAVYPSDGITKIELVRYYERVGEFMVPHLANRPLAILRAPSGVHGETFFQKSFTPHVPPHVTPRTLRDGTQIFFITNVRGLISLAQYGTIEFHPWGSRLPRCDRPDMLIWDLDPDAAVGWPEVQGTALLLRDFLADHGLHTVVKTSGGKGLHIVLFIKKTHGWDVMREFTRAVAREIASRNPSRLVITASKLKRKGKIYIDWMRNGEGSTCIAPWSLRARDGAAVSMPFNWGQIAQVKPDGFTLHDSLPAPSEWLEPRPQTITKSLLNLLLGKH